MLRYLLLALFSLMLAGCEGKPEHQALPAGATILILGDSLSYGTGARKGEDYPTLLADKSGWHIVNAGVPGDTSAGGLLRLPELLETYSPQLLLVALGGNDFLRKVPQADTVANLDAILSQAKARQIPTVLVAIPRPNLFGAAMGSLADDPLYLQLAEKTGTPLIAGVFAEVLSQQSLKADPIHPNAEGYRQVADGMREALEKMGYLQP